MSEDAIWRHKLVDSYINKIAASVHICIKGIVDLKANTRLIMFLSNYKLSSENQSTFDNCMHGVSDKSLTSFMNEEN